MKPKKLQKSEYGPKTAEFLDLAYKDYLAARVLLNAHLVVQGAVLASTAIEKYFKAILAFRGNESHGHLKKAHFNAAKNFDMRLRTAAILYPTLSTEAREQAIFIREPVSGIPQAQVILRPVNLLELDELLRAKDWQANRRKAELAHQLSLGIQKDNESSARIESTAQLG